MEKLTKQNVLWTKSEKQKSLKIFYKYKPGNSLLQ